MSAYKWPLINNNISKDDKKSLSNFILTTDRFTNGPKVKEFEEEKVKIMDNFIIKNKLYFNAENLKFTSKLKK